MGFPKVYTIYNPTLIVATDAIVHELEFGVEPGIEGAGPTALAGKYHDFRDPVVPSPSGRSDERVTLLIKVVAGTFKMSVGNDPTANPLSLAVGDTITVTVHNRVSNLCFLASGAGNSFSVSA